MNQTQTSPPKSKALQVVGGLVLLGLLIPIVCVQLLRETPPTTSAKSPVSSSSGATPSKPKHVSGEACKIESISTKVTESNSVYSKYAFILKVRNNTANGLTVDAKIKWLDSDGFVVDDRDVYRLWLAPETTSTFSDYQLITAESATRVASIQAEVKQGW